MFVFVEPFDLNDDWYLGDKQKHLEKIPNKILRTLSNPHLIGIQFLFENFVKKRGGAILNQDEDLNMPLQVCAFLCSVKNKIDNNSTVLIIASEYSLCKWHYHASEMGFQPKIISPNDFDNVGVCLLSSDSLKLTEKFLEVDLFCVVVDDFDIVATKPLVKKLNGSYNIGLTKRNFYKHPDQKLKWSMLNWVSPGCFGKLNDFYRIDRIHSLAYADNYRFWWNRLTWNFCDSFEPPKEHDLEVYHQKLKEWGDLHNIRNSSRNVQIVERNERLKQPAKRRKTNRNTELDAQTTINLKFEESECEDIQKNDTKVVHTSIEHLVKVEATNKRNDSETCSNPTKRINNEVKKNVESDGDNPILSVIYSQTTHAQSKRKDMEEVDSEVLNNTSLENFVKVERTQNMNENASYSNIPKNVESDEDEPILTIIYSQTPLATNAILFNEDNLCRSPKSGTSFSSFLQDNNESTNRSESFQRISNVLNNLSGVKSDIGVDSDDDSFFSELITGKK